MNDETSNGLSVWFNGTLWFLVVVSIPFYIRVWRRVSRDRRAGRPLLDAILPPRPRLESPLGLVDVVIMFICWFLVQSIAVSMALSAASGEASTTSFSATALVIASAGQLLGTLLGITVICIRYRRGLRIFGWQPEHLWPDTKLALTAFCMTLPGLLLVQSQLAKLIPYRHGTLEMLVDHFDTVTIAATWISAGLIAPFTEELFFRATLQGWLQRLHRGMSEIKFLLVISGGFSGAFEAGPPTAGQDIRSDVPDEAPAAKGNWVERDSNAVWLPIVLSAAAFGAVHLGQGAAPIALFLFGVVLGAIYRQRSSLWACVLLHALLNGFTLFWANLQMWLGPSASG